MDYNKKFLIIGNKNAITYKEIFPYIKENKMWIGVTPMSYDMKFILTEQYAKEIVESKKEGSGYIFKDGKVMGRAQAIWFTNIENKKRTTPIDLYRKYNPTDYPKYDNYDAIEVSKTCEIPEDYDGVMGVPITFLDKYCPTQFEIVKFRKGDDDKDLSVNGYTPYFRILIRKVS